MKWKDVMEQKYTKLLIDPSTSPELVKELTKAYIKLKIWSGVFSAFVIIVAVGILFTGKGSSEVLEFSFKEIGSFKGGLVGALIFAAIIFFLFGVNISTGKKG